MNTLSWLEDPCAAPSECAQVAAHSRQGMLTKPPGSLGRLEELAIRLAGLQGNPQPGADRVHIGIFAGDHGVTEEGVSAFPQSVTAEMVRNFAQGGAAVSVLARQLGATLEVIDLGTVCPPGPLQGVLDSRIGAGTANFTRAPAMSDQQLALALDAGRQCVQRAIAGRAQIFIGGEMGIGNTTAATAMACALLDAAPARLAGPGTGLETAGIARKAEVVKRALSLHKPHLNNPAEVLRRLGGFEIAGLVGAFIGCAQAGIPILVDGFIATAAALVADRLQQGTRPWFLFSHHSAEPGHALMLEALEGRPLLDLGMRLGEGSGAAVTVPLLRLACALHNEMATFAQAGVSEKS